ncbi:glycine oxidase ThiO [Nocardioides sp. T2.26MG-1]|uniref:glycine oxidase ThiO n=1 Tax=Nocardioides sp. T2.26MG-1 TaxID=3041166 RepID=UPI00247774E2|nr:glycine oxidase ThiO [Nocardioides sp. T2.26MG-1]CAI9403049.1 Hydrogen cyanide synthase subunit HcnC [Nocardioides sp. T2.26MG-1]
MSRDVAVDRVDVAVAGGGLIGLGIAWRCAQRGLSVTVVDVAPGSGASYAAAGMLAPVAEAGYGEERLLELCRASLASFPAFVAELERETGLEVGLRTAGTCVVGFDADDMAALDLLHAFQRELGLSSERITAREVRRREPALTPRLRGALHVGGDHSVDARALHAALLAAAMSAGVRVVRAEATALEVRDGRAAGLELAGGDVVTAGTVVLALGARSAGLPGVPPLPVRPVKGQVLRLRDASGLLEGTVRALVRGRHVYLVPCAGDRLIVGATVEEQGFGDTVTAGGVHDLLRDAIEVVPGVAELELVEALARPRPGTPDNAPILGTSPLPGLVLACGHHRNGVLLTPVTADAITELVVTGALPEVARPFTLDRLER